MSLYVRITNESYKLALTYPFAEPSELSGIIAALNETTAFQIVLKSDNRCILSVDGNPWISNRGMIEHIRVEIVSTFKSKVFIEGTMPDDGDIQRADILLSQRTVEVTPSLPTALWVDISVPEDATAGSYSITANIYLSNGLENEVLVQTFNIPLEVKKFTMPDPSDYRFYLDLWQHNSNIARQYEVELWSTEHFAIIEKCIATLAELGQKSVMVVASEIPWKGWGCFKNLQTPANLYEYAMISITRNKDGKFIYDYSVMQRYIDLCAKYSILGDIEVFGLTGVWWNEILAEKSPCNDYSDPILLRYYDESDGCYKYINERAHIEQYIRSLEQYFIRTGQIARVRIASDEPSNVEKYREGLKNIRNLAPSFKYKAALNHSEFIGEFGEEIEDFVPSYFCACIEYKKLKEYQKKLADHKFLWYVCCGPERPNTFLQSDLLEARFLGTLNAFYGFDGLLRWAYTCWPINPRKDIRYGIWNAGDVSLVYPALNGDILLSLRWKALKRGIEDYELIACLNDKGRKDIITQVYNIIYSQPDTSKFSKGEWRSVHHGFSVKYEDYEKARTLMLDTLAEI